MGNPPNIDDQNYIGSATSDMQTLAFTANPASSFSSNNNKIYIANKNKGKWTIVEELDFFKGKKGWGFNLLNGELDVETMIMYQNPFISADGNKLFFSCNVVDGFGAYDLFVSEKGKDGKWQQPTNLGSEINTKYMEMSPFLHPDNKTLYFVSNGHPGIGKLDVYRSIYNNGKWSKPEMLGEPISSPAVEIYFTTDATGEIAYFTSDRIKEADSDIYSTPMPVSFKPVRGAIIMQGTINDGFDKKPLEAEIFVEDLSTGKVIAKLQSDFETGHYSVSLPKDAEYAVSVKKDGYTFLSTNLKVEKNEANKEKEQNFEIYPVQSGTKLVLNNLFFDTGSANLQGQSMLELDRAVEILNKFKEYKIYINGHTDNVGNDASNKTLSKKRAESVKDYLVKKGIENSRLTCVGFGESELKKEES
jgi:outer membrane protein OmpA-like peptidoglycan-associated protein